MCALPPLPHPRKSEGNASTIMLLEFSNGSILNWNQSTLFCPLYVYYMCMLHSSLSHLICIHIMKNPMHKDHGLLCTHDILFIVTMLMNKHVYFFTWGVLVITLQRDMS